MADGRLNKCKECAKKDTKQSYEASGGRAEYEHMRARSPERREREKVYNKRRRERHPEKYKARAAVGNALRDGRLTKKPCENCGDPKVQAHHEDYARPLDVKWLCFKCHREGEHGHTVRAMKA